MFWQWQSPIQIKGLTLQLEIIFKMNMEHQICQAHILCVLSWGLKP